MKILHIITQGENGGGQKAVLDLADNFQKYHEVYIATGKREFGKDKWLTDHFAKDKTFEIKSLERNIDFTFRKEIKAFLEIYKLVKKVKPEIVHLHSVKAGTVGAVASKLAGAKVVYTVHGIILNEPMNIFKKIFYWTSEFIASFFRDREIFVSRKDFEIAKKYFISNDKKGVVIYNGIDFDKYKNILNKEEARDFIYGNTSTQLVGTIANLFTTKGLGYLIQAAGQVILENPNIIFVVIGEGDLRKELEELIRKNALKNNFFLVGAIPDAYKYLKAFDLFVLPSVKEGMPYTILEAAIADRKILATAVGGVIEMKKFINMHQVPAGSAEDLKIEILKILKETDLWEKEKNTNQDINKIKDNFNIIESINKIDDVYKSF